jgi:hypothetical protein
VNLPLLADGGYPAGLQPRERELAGNDLADLPFGAHLFSGVPFVVSGRVQLMGRGFFRWNQAFPSRACGLPVGRRCLRLHLLHGASFVDLSDRRQRAEIAALILHYADGEQRKLVLAAGQHVLDWWGPTMSTGISPEQRTLTDPATQLAWVGSNPALERARPGNSLRLYRTTFQNPRPGAEIRTVDFVSAFTEAAPFLVGFTVD